MKRRTFYINFASLCCGSFCVVNNGISYAYNGIPRNMCAPTKINIISKQS